MSLASSKVTSADWRGKVETELKGADFDKVLVHEGAEGLRTLPLYTEAPLGAELAALMARRSDRPVRICVRCRAPAEITEAIDGGADAVWLTGIQHELSIYPHNSSG